MSDAAITRAPRAGPTKGRREVVYRHRLVARMTHWVNVLASACC